MSLLNNYMEFDILVEQILEEAGGRCTKTTKKAPSTRKSKKWTKCAKQTDGSIKRIHWGQKGVKVTGKSGNTKRKKSFRARHKCSSAKPGTPKYYSCKNWLITGLLVPAGLLLNNLCAGIYA